VRALLDVNMLVGLSDAEHIHHDKALTWWNDNQGEGWATCPLTQNGFVRVISGSRYRHPQKLADALAQLRGLLALPGHAFWLDDISLADLAVFDHRHILGSNQITDVYLLALAVKNGGRLVTLDQGVSLRAVRGAEERHLLVV
jgi:toxin-antitoxin system PIN domain toxin